MTFWPKKNEVGNPNQNRGAEHIDIVINGMVWVLIAVMLVSGVCATIFGHHPQMRVRP